MPDGVASSPVVPKEYVGRARALRQRIEAEDDEYAATIGKLIAPIAARRRKFPVRNLRPGMLPAFVQGWRYMDARDYRTDLAARLERTRASITERRVVAGAARSGAWGEDDFEIGVGIDEVTVTVDGNRLDLSSRTLVLFSLHALARRYQRGRDNDDAAILHDLDLAARADPDGLDAGGGFKIATDAEGGGWRGRLVWLHDQNSADPRLTVLVRTWIEG
jgi:hypothetical protein